MREAQHGGVHEDKAQNSKEPQNKKAGLAFVVLTGLGLGGTVGGVTPIFVSSAGWPAAKVLCPRAEGFSTTNRREKTSRGETATNWRVVCAGVAQDEQPGELASFAVNAAFVAPFGLMIALGLWALYRWIDSWPD